MFMEQMVMDIEKTIEEYKKAGFSDYQLNEIKTGLEHGVDVSKYDNKAYLAIQMRQIRFGLEENLDVSWYAGRQFDWFQMEEIRVGLEKGLDVSCYAYENYPYDVMREIRKGLEDDIHLEKFARAGADLLRELHNAVNDKQNILPYIKAGYDPEQLAEIRQALNHGCDIDQYLETSYRGVAIREIWIGLKNGVDVRQYARPAYSWLQMKEIRLGLENRIDVSVYAKELYTWGQMREIRIGLQNKIDIYQYKSMVHPAADMRRIRRRLEKEKEQREADYIIESQQSPNAQDAEYIRDVKQTIAENMPMAGIRVVVTDDRKKAFILIEGNGKNITEEYILKVLEENNVRAGIDTELVKELAAGQKRDELIQIAEHKIPTIGENGYYKFLFETDNEKKFKVNSNGQVDFSMVSWFIRTHRGQPLAIYHSADPGNAGFLVDGTVLDGISGKDKPVLKGDGFTLLGDRKTYIADRDGCVSYRNGNLIVDRLLELDGANGITEDIDFNGSVYIKGDVRGAVKINATADIAIDGFVENATLSSMGNIFVRDGANGNGEAKFTALNMIAGKFFENVTIDAEDIIGNHFMKCCLEARRNIISYTKIWGGVIYAGKKIDAFDIGNRNYVFTQVTLGFNRKEERYKYMDELREADKQIGLLKNAMEDMKKRFKPEVRNAMPMFLKLENAVYTKEQEQKEIYKKIEAFDEQNKKLKDSTLRVHGTLYDGTVVIINDDKLEGRTLNNVGISNHDHEMKIDYYE